MTNVIVKEMNNDLFNKLFTIAVGISVALHVALVVVTLIVPPIFAQKHPPEENIIKIESLIKRLPKGANVGTQAPTKSQTAAHRPDHRKASDIAKENKVKPGQMGMAKKTRKIESKRINYRERSRQSAIERIKALKDVKSGGGGSGNKSGGNIYGIYLARVKRKLQAAWVLPPGLSPEDRRKKVLCRVKISSNGSILSSYITRSSELPHLDRSAMAAIAAVGSVPPPPVLIAKELEQKGLTIGFDPVTK